MLTFSELLSGININKLPFVKHIDYITLPENCIFDEFSVTEYNEEILLFGCRDGCLYMHKSGLDTPLKLTENTEYSAPACIRAKDGLYIMINRNLYGTDLYRFNGETAEIIYSDSVPFIATGNSTLGENGVILIPGKTICYSYSDVMVPAVMEFKENQSLELSIIDSHKLPDGTTLASPDTTLCFYDNSNYAFVRNDKLNVNLMYIARNYHNWWSTATYHNIPFTNTKICSGRLKNGRNYIIANLYPGTKKLSLFLSEPDKFLFTKVYIIKETDKADTDGITNPSAAELNGKLYVCYTSPKTKKQNLPLSIWIYKNTPETTELHQFVQTVQKYPYGSKY